MYSFTAALKPQFFYFFKHFRSETKVSNDNIENITRVLCKLLLQFANAKVVTNFLFGLFYQGSSHIREKNNSGLSDRPILNHGASNNVLYFLQPVFA